MKHKISVRFENFLTTKACFLYLSQMLKRAIFGLCKNLPPLDLKLLK